MATTSASNIIPKREILSTVILIMICFVQAEINSENSKLSNYGHQNHMLPPAFTDTQFISKNNSEIVAQFGSLAVLPCIVHYNSPAIISWIRRKDYQLLTVGMTTYSSDERYHVEHGRHMGHWSLRIKSVRDIDKGSYECQLSVHPTQSIFVELIVVEAVAEIAGSPDLHIDEGSTLRLECKLRRATEYPTYVFWYHNNKMINFESEDGFSIVIVEPIDTVVAENINPSLGISSAELLTTSQFAYPSSSSPASSSSLKEKSTISILSIREVRTRHAGNYTCSPSNTKNSAAIMVHVLKGEKPAAMQRSNRSAVEDSSSKAAISSGCTTSAVVALKKKFNLFRNCEMHKLEHNTSILSSFTLILVNLLYEFCR